MWTPYESCMREFNVKKSGAATSADAYSYVRTSLIFKVSVFPGSWVQLSTCPTKMPTFNVLSDCSLARVMHYSAAYSVLMCTQLETLMCVWPPVFRYDRATHEHCFTKRERLRSWLVVLNWDMDYYGRSANIYGVKRLCTLSYHLRILGLQNARHILCGEAANERICRNVVVFDDVAGIWRAVLVAIDRVTAID